MSENRPQRPTPPEVTIKRSQAWEAIGFFAMLASMLIAFFVNLELAMFVLLFAVYCAAHAIESWAFRPIYSPSESGETSISWS